jgi:uncharacterized repeat protein (TIGR03803 family)
VFKLDPSGQETVLYTFTGGAGGGYPESPLFRDSAGNLYGTAVDFGVWGAGLQGAGVVFMLDAAGQYSVLYTFTGGADGGGPLSGVVRDFAGNLYGTTFSGGPGGAFGYGVVYKLDPSGEEMVLHSFTDGADGGKPGAVVLGSAGSLYGIATVGGTGGGGVVFKLTLQ